MTRRVAVVLFLAGSIASGAFAGDVATFVNLGFSADGSAFMFGQFGIDEETAFPYAEAYTVDVAANRFVPNGVAQQEYAHPVSPGQDGQGALYELLRTMTDVISHHNIRHVVSGRLLYFRVNGEEPKDRVSFRDFGTGRRYTIDITQTRREPAGASTAGSAAFSLSVGVEAAGGAVTTYSVGLPDYYREGVVRYHLDRVLLSPDGNELVLVMQKDTEDRSIRYMVETLALR